jgi:hypothetical protein
MGCRAGRLLRCQTVNTRLPGDVRLYPLVCLHERCAMCDRFSPAVKTSVLRACHQSSRWLSSAAISATASLFLSRRSAQAADGIFISLMSARAFVAVVLAWESESAARVIRAGRVGDCRGWDWLCLYELLPFACPGPARPDSAPSGPDGRGAHRGADQWWRRDGR